MWMMENHMCDSWYMWSGRWNDHYLADVIAMADVIAI